jgi:DUF1707 SHOCT-like domain
MPTQRFSSLISGPPRTDHLRVSDAERQAVADRLAEHFGEGRLTKDEFDERAGRAMSATTRADLTGLFDDLPDLDGKAGSGPAGAPGGMDRRARREMRRRPGHGLLPIALIVVIALVAAQAIHAVFWLTVPWLWLGVLAVIALAATGHLGHHRQQ